MVLQIVCSHEWVMDEQEHYDKEGRFHQIIKDIALATFPDYKCEIMGR
jgi:hypothetical protein